MVFSLFSWLYILPEGLKAMNEHMYYVVNKK